MKDEVEVYEDWVKKEYTLEEQEKMRAWWNEPLALPKGAKSYICGTRYSPDQVKAVLGKE